MPPGRGSWPCSLTAVYVGGDHGPGRTVTGGEERVHADGTALCTLQVPLGPVSRTCDPRRGSHRSPMRHHTSSRSPKVVVRGPGAGRGQPPEVGKGQTPPCPGRGKGQDGERLCWGFLERGATGSHAQTWQLHQTGARQLPSGTQGGREAPTGAPRSLKGPFEGGEGASELPSTPRATSGGSDPVHASQLACGPAPLPGTRGALPARSGTPKLVPALGNSVSTRPPASPCRLLRPVSGTHVSAPGP